MTVLKPLDSMPIEAAVPVGARVLISRDDPNKPGKKLFSSVLATAFAGTATPGPTPTPTPTPSPTGTPTPTPTPVQALSSDTDVMIVMPAAGQTLIYDGMALKWINQAIPTPPPTTFSYLQDTPAVEWTIVHRLNKYPTVVVVDSGGTEIEGGVQYNNLNEVTLTFSSGFSGSAYLT